jgi:hypothetical protein
VIFDRAASGLEIKGKQLAGGLSRIARLPPLVRRHITIASGAQS